MSGDGVKTEHKSWWKSRTMIFNIIAGGVAIAQQVSPVLPPNVQAALITAIPVVNIVLRTLTTQPVK